MNWRARKIRRRSSGSATAIVERCLPLADHIARRFDGRGESRDDLVQVARVGLVNAVIRFDVNAGSDFVSFAVPTIMGEVRRHFRDNSWSVKVPRRLKELHLRLGAATAELSQRLGRAPTATELAAELEMDRDEVVEGLVAGSSYNTLSIDSGGGGNDEAPAIADTLGDVDLSLDQIENREALRPLLAALPERERTVLLLRFFESHDADADRRAGRHLADARVPAAGEVASAAPGPASVARAVHPGTPSMRRRQRRRPAESSRDRRSAAAGRRPRWAPVPSRYLPGALHIERVQRRKAGGGEEVDPVRSITSRRSAIAWRSA